MNPFRGRRGELARAYAVCASRASAHAENFPTASRLLPAAVRDHVAAFYAFAREADDWADEPGRGSPSERRAALRRLRARLHEPPGDDPVFLALAHSRAELGLGTDLLERLLDAFERDILQSTYATWDDLLSYCRDSADPVGRLVLLAAHDDDPWHATLSDRLCTALQLVNHWQDLSRDEPRGRYYLPREERARWGDARALAFAVARTRQLLAESAPLPALAPRALRPWLSAVHAGGSAVLARVEALGEDAFRVRPALGAADRVRLLGAAWRGPAAGTTFGASFGLLAPARREALAALHAYCRALDDAVDDAPDAATAAQGLAWARVETDALAQARPRGASATRLWTAWRAFDDGARALLQEGLAALLTGLAHDVGAGAIDDDDDLERYARQVGGGPGLAALPVFGRPDARAFALALGTALQRTNVLRDVADDARAGRVYLPREDLERARIAPADLALPDPPAGYRAAVRPLVVRAQAAFACARAAVPQGAAGALRPALLMGRLYEDVLTRIAQDPARVWRQRVGVGAIRRLVLVAQAALAR